MGRPNDEALSKNIPGCCHLVSGESKSLYNLGIYREDKFLPNYHKNHMMHYDQATPPKKKNATENTSIPINFNLGIKQKYF